MLSAPGKRRIYWQFILKGHRGYTPYEISRKNLPSGVPTIVPGSSQAAELLSNVAPYIEEIGFNLDLDAADTVPVTLYPAGPFSTPVWSRLR